MKKNYVWVIEMKDGKNWHPTDDANFTIKEARITLLWWQNKPDTEYRITKYEAVR